MIFRTTATFVTSLVLVGALATFAPVPRASASAAPVGVEPAANTVVTATPAHVAVQVGSAPAPAGTQITVYDAAHGTVASGTGASLVPPRLKPGTYTVVWRVPAAPGARARTGSSAFLVGERGVSPAIVQAPATDFELASPRDTVERWLALTTLMLFLGALMVRFAVAAPAARRLVPVGGLLLEQIDRRLLSLAAVAILASLPTTWWQMTQDSGDGSVLRYLADDPDGRMWTAHLLLIAVAIVAVVPAALRAHRLRFEAAPHASSDAAMAIGGIAAVLAFLTVTLPTKAPTVSWPREIFTFVLDWFHLLGASVWVGGLVALVVLTTRLAVPADVRARFWSGALRRFSLMAMLSVGVLTLSGLWTAWIHVGSVRLLFTTLYGQTLLVKVALVALLVGIGALHQLWLLPKIDAIREHGETGSTLRLTLRHFRVVVAAEATIGIAILFIVPFLSSSARNEDFQQREADLTRTVHVDGQAISLRPSGLQPGLTDYDIRTPADTGGALTVSFSSPALGVPATDVSATAVAPGRYRITGAYTSIAGDWQARVSLRQPGGAPLSGRFDLPITSEAEELGKAPTPQVHASTWAWGAAELLIVVGSLLGAHRVSRRVATKRTGKVAPSVSA